MLEENDGVVRRDLGAVLKSPDDPRDHLAERVYAAVGSEPPKTLDLRSWCQPVRDQGSTSTCAAQTATCIKEYQELHDTAVRADFSVGFIYGHRENAPAKGMYGRDVMRILHKLGAPPTLQEERDDVLDVAKHYVIDEYARVDTIRGLKQALANDGPCYISFPVFNHGPRMWKPSHPDEEQSGGHAMAVVGYTTKGFLIRNSWGDDWGDDGHCVYPYDDFGAHWEIWTAVDRLGSHAPPAPSRRISCKLCAVL